MPITVESNARGYSERKIKAATKAAIRAAAAYWHETMLPQHFTTGGAIKYNYAPRTPKYMRRKGKKLRHQRPLEYSGQSKYQAEENYTITTSTISENTVATVTMQLPSYFVQHPANSASFIDKPAELTRVTEQEEAILASVFADRLTRELGMGRQAQVA